MMIKVKELCSRVSERAAFQPDLKDMCVILGSSGLLINIEQCTLTQKDFQLISAEKRVELSLAGAFCR